MVSVNKIRFIRALINLSDNASRAVDGTTGQIWLRVLREETGDGPWVLFLVEDNGTGIEPEALEHLWDRGFSTKGSHGLGLSFVQKVVQDLGGTAQVLSRAGQGTRFTVRIPERGVFEDAE